MCTCETESAAPIVHSACAPCLPARPPACPPAGRRRLIPSAPAPRRPDRPPLAAAHLFRTARRSWVLPSAQQQQRPGRAAAAAPAGRTRRPAALARAPAGAARRRGPGATGGWHAARSGLARTSRGAPWVGSQTPHPPTPAPPPARLLQRRRARCGVASRPCACASCRRGGARSMSQFRRARHQGRAWGCLESGREAVCRPHLSGLVARCPGAGTPLESAMKLNVGGGAQCCCGSTRSAKCPNSACMLASITYPNCREEVKMENGRREGRRRGLEAPNADGGACM